jgi:hypothetical protein
MMCSEAAWWRCHRRLVLDNRVAISPDDAQKVRGASPMHADFILEKLGAVFIPENGSGYGVRLKFNNLEAAEIALFEYEGGLVADDRVP